MFAGELDGSKSHVVEAKLEGYKPVSQTFEAGKPVTLNTTLEKAQ